MAEKDYVFVSYSHLDRPLATELVEALRKFGVNVWSDFDNLRPGQDWSLAIYEALRHALALVVIVTERSASAAWVMHEVGAAKANSKGIFPVVIGKWEHLRGPLAFFQGILLPERPTKSDFDGAAKAIARALLLRAKEPTPERAKFENLSQDLLREAKTINEPPTEQTATPDSIFIVHGHDESALAEVKVFVEGIGVRPVVLKEAAGPDQSLLQRFFRVAGKAKFAIAILSADDVGASRIQFDAIGVGEKALQFRARQNVILELGFFYGQLGWDHVFVLLKQSDKIFPNFEMPSDISGAVYDRMDASGRWKSELRERLAAAGFSV